MIWLDQIMCDPSSWSVVIFLFSFLLFYLYCYWQSIFRHFSFDIFFFTSRSIKIFIYFLWDNWWGFLLLCFVSKKGNTPTLFSHSLCFTVIVLFAAHEFKSVVEEVNRYFSSIEIKCDKPNKVCVSSMIENRSSVGMLCRWRVGTT